jgi:hypothetical protein
MCPAHQSCSRAACPVRPFVEHNHSQRVRRSRTLLCLRIVYTDVNGLICKAEVVTRHGPWCGTTRRRRSSFRL